MRVLTKSGKIIIFEFKKNKLTKKDFKQLFDYYKSEFCKDEDNARAIFIVISKEGMITEYEVSDIRFCPTIIRTKLINKQKDLKVIRDKFENNKLLDSRECSLLIAFPLFELGVSEDEIVEEMCRNIAQKKDCIPDDELDVIIIGMYLNIVEYIEVEKQEDMLELIDMESRTEGVIEGLINQGVIKGRKSVIDLLLKNNSRADVAKLLGIPLNDLRVMVDS